MAPKISVIIPVYNVEQYLRECLDSVVNQTYQELQIILVDDGSTDISGAICDEYAQKDPRITVVHQKNQGAGAAKNAGLALAEGYYLSLIDSDDYIESDMYQTMVEAMEEYKVDIVQCLFDNVFKDVVYKRNYNFLKSSGKRLTPERFLFELLYDWKYAIFANKLFKAALLGDTRFPVGKKIDDEFFTYKLIGNAKSIFNLNEPLYHYRMRQSSVMNANGEDQLREDRVSCFEERYTYIRQRFPRLSQEYYCHLANYCPEKFSPSEITILGKAKRKLRFRSFANDQRDLKGTCYE